MIEKTTSKPLLRRFSLLKKNQANKYKKHRQKDVTLTKTKNTKAAPNKKHGFSQVKKHVQDY